MANDEISWVSISLWFPFLDSSEIWMCMTQTSSFLSGSTKGHISQRQRCLSVIDSYQSEGEGQLAATGPASAIPGWIRSCPATLLICGVLNGSRFLTLLAKQSCRWLLAALLHEPFESGRRELTGCVFICSMKWKPLFLQHASGISASKWQRCMKLYMISFLRSKLRWMLFLSFISQLACKCAWTWEQERLYLGRGEFFSEFWWNPHFKGLGSSHTDSLGWAEGSIPMCRENDKTRKKNGFQDFELPFDV